MVTEVAVACGGTGGVVWVVTEVVKSSGQYVTVTVNPINGTDVPSVLLIGCGVIKVTIGVPVCVCEVTGAGCGIVVVLAGGGALSSPMTVEATAAADRLGPAAERTAGAKNGSVPVVAREESIALDDGVALAVEGVVGVMVIVPVNGVGRPETGGRVYVSA
jgi:hypothetical protein